MSVSERVCNILLGLNLIALGIIGLVTSNELERLSTVRLCITALTMIVGSLFVCRERLVRSGDIASMLLAVPSIVGGIVVVHFSPPTHLWPTPAVVLFVVGTIVTVMSLISLGKCFAILPAVRSTVERGTYRLVRHPIYLGEFVLVLGCWLAKPTLNLAWIPIVVLLCIVVRILAEERLLTRTEDYRQYKERVVWRLVPGVW